MARTRKTIGDRRRRLWLVSLWSCAAAVIAAGSVIIVSSLWLIGTGTQGGKELALTLVLLSATMVASGIDFTFGQQRISIGIEGVPLLLAAFFIDAPMAIAVAALSSAWANRSLPRADGWFGTFGLAFNVSNWAITMAVTSFAVTRFLDPVPGQAAVLLPAALAAAVIMELVHDLLFPIAGELHQRGAARSFFATAKVPIAVNIALPTLFVIVLSPFAGNPGVTALLLACSMVVTYFAVWVANSQQLEQKRSAHLKQSFSRYIPEGLVNDNLDEMTEIHLGGEQRDVSVLFCDIRGFTSWSENREASEIITELNVLLSELSMSVFSTEGTLDKFTGDGLMAFWGAPLPQDDHAERACNAALDMLQRVDEVNERRIAEGQLPLAIGVGVHSGPAVIGNVGHEQRLDYTAIGDTVNLAARLEAATKEIGSVLMISRYTYDRVSVGLQQTAMRIGDITVKGRRQAVETFALQPRRPELDGIDDPDMDLGSHATAA